MDRMNRIGIVVRSGSSMTQNELQNENTDIVFPWAMFVRLFRGLGSRSGGEGAGGLDFVRSQKVRFI